MIRHFDTHRADVCHMPPLPGFHGLLKYLMQACVASSPRFQEFSGELAGPRLGHQACGDGRQPGDDGQRAAGVPVRAPSGGAQAAGHAQVVVQRLARRRLRRLRRGRQGLLRLRAHHAPGLLPLQAPPPRLQQPRRRSRVAAAGRRSTRRRRQARRARGPGNGACRRSGGGQVAVTREVKGRRATSAVLRQRLCRCTFGVARFFPPTGPRRPYTVICSSLEMV
ncbi:hypothetical protein BS78_01G369900 [Paspalum vaginatum]|nr:hypothetical protein BS78_01G369900 [Paspalum vaginatum]